MMHSAPAIPRHPYQLPSEWQLPQKGKVRKGHVVAVIGDGAMTAGEAFEGLNNAGIAKSDILVILNDNNMAIDPNVGALKEYLLDITTSRTYNRFRNKIWNLLGRFGSSTVRNAERLQDS